MIKVDVKDLVEALEDQLLITDKQGNLLMPSTDEIFMTLLLEELYSLPDGKMFLWEWYTVISILSNTLWTFESFIQSLSKKLDYNSKIKK